jgi:hypothetical protein
MGRDSLPSQSDTRGVRSCVCNLQQPLPDQYRSSNDTSRAVGHCGLDLAGRTLLPPGIDVVKPVIPRGWALPARLAKSLPATAATDP